MSTNVNPPVRLASVPPNVLESIAFNLCSLHDFDVAFVRENERFARAVITEYARFLWAGHAPEVGEATADVLVRIKGRAESLERIGATQDASDLRAVLKALAARHEASAEAGEIDEDWIRGLIGEAVCMAEDQEREDESDEEICRIAESVLNAIRPYLRAHPPAREDAQPVGIVDGLIGRLNTAELDDGTPLYTHPAPDALREFGKHRNLELSYRYADEDDDGAWLVHRVNGGRNDREWAQIGSGETPPEAINQALAALQTEQKGGAA